MISLTNININEFVKSDELPKHSENTFRQIIGVGWGLII